jgi:type II secretory pathway predicted ATPase ExeA
MELPYLSYFHLKEEPFSTVPSPRYLFLTSVHATALSKAEFVVETKKGLAVVFGDTGTGKSSLARLLHQKFLDRPNVVSALMTNPDYPGRYSLLRTIALELGVPRVARSYADMLMLFKGFLFDQHGKGKTVVLMIDEAQTLRLPMIEFLRELANIETNVDKLLQLVLFAQEERSLALRIAAAFGQFAGFNGPQFSSSTTLNDGDWKTVGARRWPQRLLPLDPPVTVSQAAMLFHPPEEATTFSSLRAVHYRRTAIANLEGGVPLGAGRSTGGQECPVRLRPRDLLRHAFVIGPSGSGKTTFLSNLALELIAAGHGVTVVDPHGTLASAIARTLPSTRQDNASLLQFSDSDYPVSLNPFRAPVGYESLAADEVVEIVQRVYGREYWGPHLDLLLRHAAIATIELRGSVVEAARLLEDPWFRERALSQIRNPETARFLAQLAGDVYDRRLLPAVQRLQRLLASPWLRNILGQTVGGLDFAQALRRREVLLMDLSGLGMNNAKLLGSLVLLMLRQATMSRRTIERGDPSLHFVLVDEASWFINRTVAELFDQARKFGVGVILAVQRLGQLGSDETREAILANAGSLVSFRITDREEATFLSRHLASDAVGPLDLQHLPRFEAYAQLTRDDDRLPPAWMRTTPPAEEPADARAVETRLIEAGRLRYARPRHEVEEALRARERALLEDEEPEIRAVAPATLALSAHPA